MNSFEVGDMCDRHTRAISCRSRKALSPVVAAIILIAVTVAVSVAVATWMGAITYLFVKIEQLMIEDVDFTVPGKHGPPGRRLTIYVRNTGTITVTITDAKIGGSIIPIDEETIEPGEEVRIKNIPFSWVNGTMYNIAVITETGNLFAYIAKAPSG